MMISTRSGAQRRNKANRTGHLSAGQATLLVVLLLGLAGLALALLGGIAVWKWTARDPSQIAQAATAKSPFDGKRAFADLERIVAIGPRPSGSPELEQLREMIRRELTAAGLSVWEHAFEANTPIGKIPMVNLVGVVQGTTPGIIVLGNHYETKLFTTFRFVGANDAGSSTAWMIEMARALGPRRTGRTVWLCFFDGEEAFVNWSEQDSLYGSRAFVEHLRSRGELSRIAAMINVDMIGDRYLGIYRDRSAPTWLNNLIWTRARALGYEAHFLPQSHNVQDDHVPFRRAGVPAIVIIDFVYGGSILDHNRTWHTANDTLDKVCADSLQVVGDVLYHALGDIDAHPDGKM